MSIKSSIKAVSHWPLLRYFCAFIGGVRKENRWGIRGALVFGGGTLAFHTLLFGIGIVCSILLIFLIFSFLTGGSLV